MDAAMKRIISEALKAKGLNQSQLAVQLGKERASISRTLSRSPLDQRSDWPRILELLDLEIVIRPKRQTEAVPAAESTEFTSR
ncbi:hypothetical protein [Deinococcus aquiradiocola]|uniref:hypothetical protein n=1 Tax=Deinococcus aquiradiocola TaxID=393059 RepID=UPI0016685889|nr:hypothetical protein [Deinococcus aquiradiocola]